MKALVYHGPNDKSWDEVPDPKLIDTTDAIVRVDATTICGSDLHILKGHLPEVPRDGSSVMKLSAPWRRWVRL